MIQMTIMETPMISCNRSENDKLNEPMIYYIICLCVNQALLYHTVCFNGSMIMPKLSTGAVMLFSLFLFLSSHLIMDCLFLKFMVVDLFFCLCFMLYLYFILCLCCTVVTVKELMLVISFLVYFSIE